MKGLIEKTALKNRYTLLLSTIAAYILLVVIEGIVTGRELATYSFENPFFDFNLENFQNLEQMQTQDD